MHHHSPYFLNAKCTQSTLMQKHSRRSLSIPNVTELSICRHLYSLTDLPSSCTRSFLKSRTWPTNIWSRHLRSSSLRTALPQDSVSSWKSSTTHFNLNYRINLTHPRPSQPMFPALQHYSHSCLLNSHSEFCSDFSITHPASEDSSAFHD